tara:strand:+ start:216 stop:623 length:408 start_codon:yes stop_codon:yes gene_type:complete
MRKKGQAQIITTILIILVVLAAIVIIWNVINRTVTDKSKEVSVEKFSVTLSTAQVDLSQDPILIPVAREVGQGDLIAIRIIFIDDTGNNYVYENTTYIPDELETIIYSIPRSDITLINIQSFEVYPILIFLQEEM